MEDAEQLAVEAFLSVLGEFALDGTESETSSTMQDRYVSTDASRRSRNERKKVLRRAGIYADPNRARKERKRELSYLREQVAKLGGVLEALQTGKKLCDGSPIAVLRSTSSSGVWEALAERQRQRREAAQEENARLKQAVDRQKKVAEALKTLMLKRTNQLAAECSSLLPTDRTKPKVARILDHPGDITEFEELFRHIEAAYCEQNAVFKDNGLANLEDSTGDVHMRENVDGKCLEFFTHKVLPFDRRSTADATWDLYKGLKKHLGNGNLYEKTVKDLDEPYTIVEDFTKEIYSNSSRADVRMKQVLRRFEEED